MKSTVTKLLLCFTASIASLTAQEAWLLEMPNKYADYLVKKSFAKDYDTVAGVLEKLPGLIASQKIREIELIKFNGEGKVHKKGSEKLGERTVALGSSYRGSPSRRTLRVTTGATKRNYQIDSYGLLSRAWTPTFAHRDDKLTLLLLERKADGESAVMSLSHLRMLDFKAGTDTHRVSWHSGDPLDGQTLNYSSRTVLVANPQIEIGTKLFTKVSKEGNSLLRMEIHGQPSSEGETVSLHHNEARLTDLAETTGPLKKEVIKIADKSFTKEANGGTWTLTVKNED